MMALLLDLSNIVGGFLLAIALIRQLPGVGDDAARGAAAIAPFGWVVGVVALVAGGYYLIVHLTGGPHVFHFEVVGIGVGVALLWDRLHVTTRSPAGVGPGHPPGRSGGVGPEQPAGAALLLAVFGLIAVVVGLQGLVTPN